MAFIAYYFHWPLPDILELQHADRRRWVEEISDINRRLGEPDAYAQPSVGLSSEWTGWSPAELNAFRARGLLKK